MRKLAVIGACALGLTLSAVNSSATPVAIGDAYYVGHILDGIPSDLASEVDYITNLLTLAAGEPISNCGSGSDPCYTTIGSEQYTRLDSTLPGSLPAPSLSGAVKVDPDPANTGISVTGFTYILGKYDQGQAGAYVWYVPTLAVVDLPAAIGTCGNNGGCRLSHYSLFTVTVPDGGATLILLGGALVALGALRRKFSV